MLTLFLCAFPWPTGPHADALLDHAPLPPGYVRIAAAPGSFAAWLRDLPMKPGHPPVLLFNGAPKANQHAHVAVFDVDVGAADLQQCADAVMRLRAEFQWSRHDDAHIHFALTSGDDAPWARWRDGERPLIVKDKRRQEHVHWVPREDSDASYPNFRRYLDLVFLYAGSASLEGMLQKKAREPVEVGDVFIQGGHPGHAVIVVDVAEKKGERVFLLAQSYMPAQNIQLLANPADPALSPWYRAVPDEDLRTPEWIFHKGALRRFPEAQ